MRLSTCESKYVKVISFAYHLLKELHLPQMKISRDLHR